MKYLSDGRKVTVIGQLNNVETIVQEIFITEQGDEIPSGERFVVKSLHDTPVESWKSKEEAKLNERIKKLESDIENKNKEYKNAYNQLEAIRALLAKSKMIEAAFTKEHVERISAFMTATIQYLVIEEYEITPPVKMIDRVINWDNYYGSAKFDEIKLLSVLGRSDGDLSYRINRYSDGSGGGVEVHPCLTLEEAHEKIKSRAQSLIDVNRLTDKSYKACIDMGIKFDESSINKYLSYKKEVNKKTKEDCLKNISKYQALLDSIDDTN